MMKQMISPLLQQYQALKEKYADCILLFQVGDFYETFGTDADVAARVLGLQTSQRLGERMAGFPFGALDQFLPELARAGYRVAVCDQGAAPADGSGLLERTVTQIVTPGLNTTAGALETSSNNFLGALHIEGTQYGLALLDVLTGEFYAGEG